MRHGAGRSQWRRPHPQSATHDSHTSWCSPTQIACAATRRTPTNASHLQHPGRQMTPQVEYAWRNRAGRALAKRLSGACTAVSDPVRGTRHDSTVPGAIISTSYIHTPGVGFTEGTPRVGKVRAPVISTSMSLMPVTVPPVPRSVFTTEARPWAGTGAGAGEGAAAAEAAAPPEERAPAPAPVAGLCVRWTYTARATELSRRRRRMACSSSPFASSGAVQRYQCV